MSRFKIQKLYFILILTFILFVLFYFSSNFLSFSSLKHQRVTKAGPSLSQDLRIFDKQSLLGTGDDVLSAKNSTQQNHKMVLSSISDGSTVIANKSMVAVDMDILKRIEDLLTDIKQNQEENINRGQMAHFSLDPGISGQRSKDMNNLGDFSNNLESSKVNNGKKIRNTEIKLNKKTDKDQDKSANLIPGVNSKSHNGKDVDNLLINVQNMLQNFKQQHNLETGESVNKEKDVKNLGENFVIKQPKNDPGHTSRPDVCDSCFKNDFKYLINPDTICKHSTDLDLLILIATSPMDSAARDAIRQTWGSTPESKSFKIQSVFIIGVREPNTYKQNLEEESEKHGDIVQLDFSDSYANLTFKTLSAMRWAAEFCPNTKYVMKTDSDMFVNTLVLPNILKGAPKSDFLGGFCWGRSTPHREKSSKWYVSFKSYMHSSFPPMCSGTGYIMSTDVVLGILQTSKNIPYFHLEDVFVALCVKPLKVKPVNLQGFSNMKTTYDKCSYRYRVATSHSIIPDQLIRYWHDMKLCQVKSPELEYRPIPYPIVH